MRDGRLKAPINKAFLKLNASIDFDKKLYREDIVGSLAYVKALERRGIIKKDESSLLIDGLSSIEKEIEGGKFLFKEEDEDIHMNIERRLFEKVGRAAYKLHTGRSRNEQVVLDERLYLITTTRFIKGKLTLLFKALVEKAKLWLSTIIPSYTHMRKAQPISISHLLLAYYHALRRDTERLDDYQKRLKVLPLGSGASAGSSIGIDRDLLLQELPFESLSRNSIDAVSTRDFIIEFEFICVSLFLTLSRISEDIILFSSDEFGYYTLPDDLSTTSSLMPQKKNPDALELIRGKSARVIGNLVSIITLMKGVPYAYNRDFQEDKEGLFDTVENTTAVIDVMIAVIKGLTLNEENVERALSRSRGTLFATDVADYLVEKGLAFREAHQIVGAVVRYMVEHDVHFSDIPLEKYKSFFPGFEEDIYEVFDYIRSVNRHDVPGGTALKKIAEEIKRIENELKNTT